MLPVNRWIAMQFSQVEPLEYDWGLKIASY